MTPARRGFFKIIAIMLVLGICPIASAAQDSAEKTLSPYFFVENGDEGVDRLPLKSTQVTVTLDAVIADVTVIQTYVNEGSRPIHARYVFPASTRAAVHGMRMKIGEKVIAAKIEERQKATQTFEKAKKQGKGASLLTEERPNVFTMQVANIMPGEQVEVHLDYSELLVPEEGIYEFVYPTVVGPRYSTLPEAGAQAKHQWIKNPFLKEGQESPATFNLSLNIQAGLPIADMVCPSHQTEIAWQGDSAAQVRLAPTETNGGNRDYILRYRLSGERIHSGLMLFEGETENYFLLTIQPPQRVTASLVPPREYIFVIDVSGSMNGFPLDTAKVLLRQLISGLKPQDRFNVILFSGGAQVLASQSLSADPAHLNQAIRLIDDQQGGGGTELRNGLETALKLPRTEGVSRSVVVVTDGYIALEKEVFALIEKHMDQTNFFAFGIGSSVNRYLIEGLARIGQGEPFVVTDPSEAMGAARRFRTYIESPVLTQVKLRQEGWDVYDQEPKQVCDLFAKRPLVICGKYHGKPEGKVHLTGLTGAGEFSQTIDLKKVPVSKEKSALPQLWARTRLARLMDFDPEGQDSETTAQITSLGLTYHLLTPHTAFVAVDETVRNPTGDAEDTTQPSPLPQGVSNLAVSGGNSVPEPELYLMMSLLALAGLASWMRSRRRRILTSAVRRASTDRG